MTTTATMPKHIKDAGDKATKDLEAIRQGKDPDAIDATTQGQDGQGPAGQPTGQTTQTIKDAKDEAIERLQAENAALRKSLNDEDGKRGGKLQQLQAQLDATVGQVSDLTKTIGEQAEVIKTLKANPNAGPATGDSVEDALKIVGSEFVREYGREIPEATMKLVRAAIERNTGDLKAELDEIKAQLKRQKDAGAKSDQDRALVDNQAKINRIWNDVEKLYPGARAINGDPALELKADPLWLAFCKERHPETGILNSVIGEQAFGDAFAGDDAGVTNLANLYKRFDAWKAKRNGTGPRVGEQRVDAGAPGERQEGPRGPAGGPPDGGQKPTMKQSDFNAFTLDQRLNPTKYSMAEVNEKKRAYKEAALEGRLIMDVR